MYFTQTSQAACMIVNTSCLAGLGEIRPGWVVLDNQGATWDGQVGGWVGELGGNSNLYLPNWFHFKS